MSRIVRLALRNPAWTWTTLAAAAAVLGVAAGYAAQSWRESGRAVQLQTETQRSAVEIMAHTLNGNLMGSVTLLGMLDEEIKRDARGEIEPNPERLVTLLEGVTRAYDAQGSFLVRQSGIVGSSWDSSGKPSTGLDVSFRPYFRMAMQGKENVYAAVSLARGDRALYFAAPVRPALHRSGDAIGAVVARTGLAAIDAHLKDKADVALLLSPQGVVFAGSRSDWIGALAGEAAPDRLQKIRELKQFGNMFEGKAPVVLPIALEDGHADFEGRRFAVASAPVQWNDPYGDWRLVLLEDVSRSVPAGPSVVAGAAAAVALLALAAALLQLARSREFERTSSRRVEAYAREQAASAERKARLNAAALSIQQAESVAELTKTFLAEAHDALGAVQGVVYVHDADDGQLHLAGSYACPSDLPQRLAPGEGLLGQCALEWKLRVIATPGDGIWTVHSGLGSTPPAALLLAPVVLHDMLLGVVELALLEVPDEAARQQFEEMVKLLGLNLAIVQRSERTEERLNASVAAERAKADQLMFQQALLDSIPYAMFHTDAQGRIVGANRAFEEAFGKERGALVGRSFAEVGLLGEWSARLHAEIEATAAGCAKTHGEAQVPFADGKLRDTLYFLSGVRLVDGSCGGVVGAFIDMTSTKDAERELARLADADRFSRLAANRELRILEIKREVNELARVLGREPPYDAAAAEAVVEEDTRDSGSEADELPKRLDQLVDLADLQTLFSNFCDSVGVAAAIIDLDGKVLAAARWQRACTDFHRVHPESCARCIESDTELALQLEAGRDFTLYRCKNGMTDCAAPIVVEGRHLANVFIGQFHVGPPDLAFFAAQAKLFGYAEDDYLNAVAEAPQMDERRLPAILGFLSGFARMVATMSLARHRADAAQRALQHQADALRRERLAALSLAEDAAKGSRSP